jgi:hypothetical protein
LTSLLTIHTKNPTFGVKNGGPDYQKNITSDFMRNFALLKCQAPLRARESLGPPFFILLYNFKNVNCHGGSLQSENFVIK